MDRPVRILHLEDSRRDAELVQDTLALAGISCEIVQTDRKEVFEASLDGDTFDLILCDYSLPDYDGMKATQLARAKRLDVPVIILSGSLGEERAVECLRNGATDFVLKQNLKRLIPVVERALREAEERRRRGEAERAQRESEKRYRSLFENMLNGFSHGKMLFHDGKAVDFVYLDVNRAFQELTGLRNVIGRKVTEVIPEIQETNPELLDLFGRVALTGARERLETYVVPLGTWFSISVYSPEREHFVAIFENITERKRAEETRAKLEEQLRQAQKMEAVGRLAGGIAHDFNNILQALIGFAELLKGTLSEEEKRWEWIVEIEKGSNRAAALTRQLLAFSRRQVLKLEDLDLNEVVADAMKMIGRVIGADIRIDFVPGHRPGTVHADHGQLEQILMNLCVNSRDAMPEGGSIAIETENVLIDGDFCATHPWATPGRYVLLSVTDTGCGMDAATLEHVFEPFFTTKEPGRGTGLGLATVYGIVRQHHGMIHPYSEAGKGTTFKIYLPVVERPAVTVGPKILGKAQRGTESILVAEDDEPVRQLARHVLEEAGYTVLTAANGREALRIVYERTEPVHLALLDVVMPELGGRAVRDTLRKRFPAMRFLFSSGYTTNAIHAGFVLDEGIDLLQKPYAPRELLRRVREVLDRQEA